MILVFIFKFRVKLREVLGDYYVYLVVCSIFGSFGFRVFIYCFEFVCFISLEWLRIFYSNYGIGRIIGFVFLFFILLVV